MKALALLATFALSACADLPSSGPSTSAVLEHGSGHAAEGLAYQVVDINETVVDTLGRKRSLGLGGSFGVHPAPAEPTICVGDSLSVTIWEAGGAGLFSSPSPGAAGAPAAGSNSAAIPPQTVGRDGAITVPFVGRVRVAGRTARGVQTAIENALEGKAVQPQALVSVLKSVGDAATVGGDAISAAQRVPLSVKGDRLLDVIASAGGVRFPVDEIYVELQRGDRTARAPLSRAIADPSENLFIWPGDVVSVLHDPPKFLALGATGGGNAEVTFGSDGLSLASAIAKAGGLYDNRSDPKGVFVFRWESADTARALRPDSPRATGVGDVPVVYRLDLTDPKSLFLEQKFRIANRDLLYVSNSPFVEIEKVVGVFANAISPASSAAGIGAAVAHGG